MAAAAPRINPLKGVDHPGPENGDLVFCEDSTSPLVVSKALMELVCNQVNEGVWALPRGGGVEVGGLLIGAKGAGNRVTVERIVPITTEHRFGQAFHLSPTDLGGLEQTIASAHQEQSRSVIGFYRSRTRGDAIPRESDQEILNTLARVHPGYEIDFRFFLIFTPLSKSVVEISIAQRRDGGWHEWREVKLRTEPMAFILDSETDSSLERAKYPGLALEPAAVRPPLSAPAPPAPPRPQERAGNKPRLWLYGAIALVIVAGATGANFWITTHPSAPAPLPKAAPPAESLRTGFAANPEGSMWKLTWNRDAVAALHASGAVLSIRDGANEQRVSLTEADLSTGTVFYTPQTGSLLFSLILLTPGSLPVEEHVRVLEAVRASTKPAEPTVQIQLDHQKLRTLRPFSDTSQPAGQPAGRKTAAPEIAAPPVLPAANGAALNASIQLPMQAPTAPPSREAAVVSTPLPQTPAPVPVSAPIPQTPAAATTAPPLPQTPVGAAAQTLEPVPAKQPGYIAPKPIRQMSAMLPADAHATTSMTVQLRVEIDASGKVGKVTPTGRNATNFKLMDAAIRAAKFWVFEPAQENGHAVPSEIVLNFHFGAQ